MKYCQLGNSNLYLSELGFGCASIWGKSFFNEEKAFELFFKSVELGINFFDTSYSYNDAERRLGVCLKESGIEKRKKLIISTKCGTRESESGKYYHDWSVDWLKQSVEISLKRLNTDHVEMLHLHGPTIKDMSDEVLNFMNDLKSQNITKTIGVNSFDTEVLTWICNNKLFDFVMLDYNIMRQDREELIKNLYHNGIGVIGGAALAQSLYSNRVFKIHNKIDIWYMLRALKNWRHHIKEGRKFRFLNKIPNISGNQAALRFTLDNKYITSSVFSTSSIEHLVENCQAVNFQLPKDIIKRIKKIGVKNSNKLDRK